MRIVIKIGTSTLAYPGGRLNIRHTEELVKTFSDLKNAGHEIILVSSGAIGMGAGKLQIARPADMPTKQAAASVGQCELMYTYDRLFNAYNHTVGQILLTREDFNNPGRLLNLENTLYRLLALGVIPIVNENDSLATEEISVGDNDTMGALVAKYMQADLLVLLSDIDGLYTADPHTHPDATLIREVPAITPEIEALAGGAGQPNCWPPNLQRPAVSIWSSPTALTRWYCTILLQANRLAHVFAPGAGKRGADAIKRQGPSACRNLGLLRAPGILPRISPVSAYSLFSWADCSKG